MSSGDCPVNWIVCPPCEGIPDALGHSPYSYSQIADAPWYDVQEEPSHRFLGVHAISMDGLNDSTRQASIAEGINDGGVVGNVRHAVRQVRVRALLSALGEDALESGLAWLKAALDPDTCGTHGNACGAVDSCFYVACPPTRAEVTKPAALWGDPITNLATNPSMETISGVNTIRTNLATNPSFEATTAATVEVRRNQCVNPSFETNTTGWQGSSSAIARSTADKHGGAASVLVTASNASSTTGDVRLDQGSAVSFPPNIAAGKTYTISAWINTPVALAGPTAATSSRQRRILAWYSIDGTALVPMFGPQGTNTVGWQRISTTFAVPANATGVLIGVGCAGSPTDPSFLTYVDDVLIEESPVLGDYFDGSTVPVGDFTHAWVGTANASASVQYGLWPSTGPGPIVGAAVLSSEWASSGTKSMRLIPNSPVGSNQTRALLTPTFAVTAGQVYTAIAKVRLSAPLVTSGLWANALKLSAYFADTATLLYSTAAPNAAGISEIRFTITVPAGNTTMDVRFNSGAPAGGGDVWVDDYLLIAGNYTGPYFDGSTPPKVRRNLATLPTPYSSYYFNSNNTSYYPVSYDATVGRRAGVGSSLQTRAAVTLNNQLASWYSVGSWAYTVAGRPKATPGQTYTISGYFMSDAPTAESNIAIAFFDAAGAAIGSAVYSAKVPLTLGEWTRVSITGVAPANAASVGSLAGTVLPTPGPAAAGGEKSWLTDVLIEEGATVGDWFDGATAVAPYGAGWEGSAKISPSYLTDADFTYAWTGTANASTSAQAAGTYGTGSGMPTADPAQAIRYQTSDTPASRFKAARYELTTTGAIAIPVTSFAPTTGAVYTLLGKVRAVTRDQVLTPRIRGAQGTPFTAPKGVWTDFAVTVAAGSGSAAQTGLLLASGSGHQVGDIIDVDAVTIVEGEYGGDYFDGSFPDVPTFDETQPITLPIGTTLNRYEWTGTVDASTSVHESGIIVAVEDPEGFDLLNDSLLRSMHNVTCISGPLIEQKLHRDDLWGYIVEFTLAAGTPWLFGVTREVKIPNGFPIVIQDVPFNLIRYPSAELTAGTITVSTNYAANPSVETNDTGWVKTSSGTPAADTVGARSTTLAAQGTASYRIRFTATTTSASASTIRADHQTATFPAAVAGTRMSVNMWATSQVASGTAVVSQTRIFVIWRQGSTVLRTDTLGTVPAGGGAVSGKSLVPPVGADNAIVRAEATVDSWSTGAVIDVYADAVAVTVP